MYSGPVYPIHHTHKHNFYARQASHLVGRLVRINRGGHDSVEGVLVAIPSDYLVVLTDEGIVYVNGAHVKSITEGVQESEGKSGGGRSGGGRSGGNRSRYGRSRSYVSASSFQSLLHRMRHKHIQINRGGPEKLDGFLAEVASDNVLLIVDRELVRIPTFHIKTVMISSSQDQNKNKNNNKSGSGGNKNKSGSKSNSKRSGGGKGGRGGR
ncbi:hypothetical protein [Cohnella kolymensis]|uniref:hypothetical protein n=1 Tax=Cohnella kolymensis TaxID=1590652 RepID=UPI000697F849|nr:hypothetical protein [Cohnella kolymensis]